MFREADFVTIHTPLTPETRHIENRQTLSLMKPTAYLVNPALGGMVDAGAGIDVFEVEPPPPDYPLFGWRT